MCKKKVRQGLRKNIPDVCVIWYTHPCTNRVPLRLSARCLVIEKMISALLAVHAHFLTSRVLDPPYRSLHAINIEHPSTIAAE